MGSIKRNLRKYYHPYHEYLDPSVKIRVSSIDAALNAVKFMKALFGSPHPFVEILESKSISDLMNMKSQGYKKDESHTYIDSLNLLISFHLYNV